MSPIKTALRRSLTALLWMLARPTSFSYRNPRVFILTYHSVDGTDWKYGISPEMFKRQMEYLKRHYRPVPLSEIVRFAKGECDLPDGSVAITFDDGYRSVYENAFPVLSKLEIPAIVFVVTSLEAGRAETEHRFPMMTWEDLRQMQTSHLVTVGSHTATHQNLDLLPEHEMRREIQDSKDAITANLGTAPEFFSYPKGRFSEAVKRMVQSLGFTAAVSIKQGMVRPGDDPYRLPRIEVNRDVSFSEFRMRLTPAIEWLTFFWRKYHGF